jgi:hypothetical protein
MLRRSRRRIIPRRQLNNTRKPAPVTGAGFFRQFGEDQLPAAVPLTLPMPEPVPGCAPVGFCSWALAESGLPARVMPVLAAPFFAGGTTAVEETPPTFWPAVSAARAGAPAVGGACVPALLPTVLWAKAAVIETGARSSADDRKTD